MRKQVLGEVLFDELRTIREYVSDIPEMKADIHELKTDVSQLKDGMSVVKLVLKDHSKRITKLETKAG